MSVGPLLSSTWFPPDERALSTAINSLANFFGVGLSFLIGPFLVKLIFRSRLDFKEF